MFGIVKDHLYLEHVPDDYHPENPKRLEAIYSMLDQFPREEIIYIRARDATKEEISYVHDPSYVDHISKTLGRTLRLDPDTYVSPRSYEVAVRAVGGLLSLCDAIMEGKVASGFALIRPPGHHAEKRRAMGFCLFNNIAIAARYLKVKYGLGKIAIIDFDLHHGNGTQKEFYSEKDFLYFSTHQYPYYPGTGSMDEIGSGDGLGYTVNVPLPYGMGNEDYTYVFREILLPILYGYEPSAILVSAGFDAYYRDPLGGMNLTEEGYASMTALIKEAAIKVCGGKVLFALEGGYNIEGLASCVRTVIETMLDRKSLITSYEGRPKREAIEIVDKLKRRLSPYWKF